MLNIHLIVVGDKTPAWVAQGFQAYARRIHGRCALTLTEIPAERRGKQPDISRILSREAVRLKQAIPSGNRIVALDRGGKTYSTIELSRHMDGWLQQGEQVSILVGGPEGLSTELLQEADETWSLSALTFAHPLVRVIMAEQIYRCYSVLEGLPYHR